MKYLSINDSRFLINAVSNFRQLLFAVLDAKNFLWFKYVRVSRNVSKEVENYETDTILQWYHW